MPDGSADGNWGKEEIEALHYVHADTDITEPDFWAVVTDKMRELGYARSTEECQRRWFRVLFDAEEKSNQSRQKTQGMSHSLGSVAGQDAASQPVKRGRGRPKKVISEESTG
jgi:hypothetical protein